MPLDDMRKTIAAWLTQTKQSIPYFYLTADVAMDALLKVRAEAKQPVYKGPLSRSRIARFSIYCQPDRICDRHN